MSIKTVGVLAGSLLVIIILFSGCGVGDGGKEGAQRGGIGDKQEGSMQLKVALCPKGGGEMKFLELDSLKLVSSGLKTPVETIYLRDIPSSSRFAVVTREGVYLMPKDESTEEVRIPVPPLSNDLRVVPVREGLLILDRESRKLIGVNTRIGKVELTRTLPQPPEEIYYYPSEEKVALVMGKGNRGIISVLSLRGGESMTINLNTVLCSASAEEKGEIYLVTEGTEGARLEVYHLDDLTKVIDERLEQKPGSIVYAAGSGKVYFYYPLTGIIEAVNIAGGEIVSEIPLEVRGNGRLISDESGRYVYLLMDDNGYLTAISTENDIVEGEIANQEEGTTLLTTPSSRFVLLQDSKGSRVRLYDGDKLQLLRVFMEGTPMTIGLLRGQWEESVSEDVMTVKAEPGTPTTPSWVDVPEWGGQDEEEELFTLQVFSSDVLKSSERVADKLNAAGFPAFIEEVFVAGKGAWYRVRVGEFSSKEDAKAIGSYIKVVLGLEYWVSRIEGDEMTDAAVAEIILQGQDMDADGLPEVAVIGPGGVVRIFSLYGNRYVPRWSYSLPSDQVLCGTITYMDENGDGLPEALLPLCPLDRNYIVLWKEDKFMGETG